MTGNIQARRLLQVRTVERHFKLSRSSRLEARPSEHLFEQRLDDGHEFDNLGFVDAPLDVVTNDKWVTVWPRLWKH